MRSLMSTVQPQLRFQPILHVNDPKSETPMVGHPLSPFMRHCSSLISRWNIHRMQQSSIFIVVEKKSVLAVMTIAIIVKQHVKTPTRCHHVQLFRPSVRLFVAHALSLVNFVNNVMDSLAQLGRHSNTRPSPVSSGGVQIHLFADEIRNNYFNTDAAGDHVLPFASTAHNTASRNIAKKIAKIIMIIASAAHSLRRHKMLEKIRKHKHQKRKNVGKILFKNV